MTSFRASDTKLSPLERARAFVSEYAEMEAGEPGYNTDSDAWLGVALDILRSVAAVQA